MPPQVSDHALRVSCVQPLHGTASAPLSKATQVPCWQTCSSHVSSTKPLAAIQLEKS